VSWPGFAIKGVPDDLCERFAKRRVEIEREIDKFEKEPWPGTDSCEVTAITRKTRPAELKEISTKEVRKLQFGQLNSRELGPASKKPCRGGGNGRKMGHSAPIRDMKDGPESCRRSSFRASQRFYGSIKFLAEALNQNLGSLDLGHSEERRLRREKVSLIRLAAMIRPRPFASEYATRRGLQSELRS